MARYHSILLLIVLSQHLTVRCSAPPFPTGEFEMLQEREYGIEVVRTLYDSIIERTDNIKNQFQSWLLLKRFIASPKAIPYVRQLIKNTYRDNKQDHMDIIVAFINVINNYNFDDTLNEEDDNLSDRLDPEVQKIINEAKVGYRHKLSLGADRTEKPADNIDDMADISDILADYSDIIHALHKSNANTKFNSFQKKKMDSNEKSNDVNVLDDDFLKTKGDQKKSVHKKSKQAKLDKRNEHLKNRTKSEIVSSGNDKKSKIHKAVLGSPDESASDSSYGFRDWNLSTIAQWVTTILGFGMNTDTEKEQCDAKREESTVATTAETSTTNEMPKIQIIVKVDDSRQNSNGAKPVITVNVDGNNRNVSYQNEQNEDNNNNIDEAGSSENVNNDTYTEVTTADHKYSDEDEYHDPTDEPTSTPNTVSNDTIAESDQQTQATGVHSEEQATSKNQAPNPDTEDDENTNVNMNLEKGIVNKKREIQMFKKNVTRDVKNISHEMKVNQIENSTVKVTKSLEESEKGSSEGDEKRKWL